MKEVDFWGKTPKIVNKVILVLEKWQICLYLWAVYECHLQTCLLYLPCQSQTPSAPCRVYNLCPNSWLLPSDVWQETRLVMPYIKVFTCLHFHVPTHMGFKKLSCNIFRIADLLQPTQIPPLQPIQIPLNHIKFGWVYVIWVQVCPNWRLWIEFKTRILK